MSQNSYSEKFDLKKESQLKQSLFQDGFDLTPFDHAFWRAKGGNVTATFYKSGKFLVQGKGTSDFIVKYLNATPQLTLGCLKTQATGISHSFKSWMGTDESGKGDYFGPLVIAGVLIDQENKEAIEDLKVQDSKKMTDVQIEKIAWQIKNNSTFSVVTITPVKYNDLYGKFKNLNKLLAWGHARVIENILDKKACNNAISDKFGDESLIKNALLKKGQAINLVQRTKAESDLAVAAASVIARYEFVIRMREMSKKYGMEFPKGASKKVIEHANLFVNKYDYSLLGNVAKLHFKTTKELDLGKKVL